MPLLVTVELIPHGNYKKKVKIGELYIENDGSGDRVFGNYSFELKGQEFESNLELGTQQKGQYKNFERVNGYWGLIKRILNSISVDNNCKKEN